MHAGKIKGFSGLLFSCLFCSASVTSAGDQDLAKASQNPVANMISLPMKNKFNFGVGEEDAFGYELELQPVLPVSPWAAGT